MTKATVENKALSRRSFLKGGAVLAAGSVAAPAVIAGSHSKASVLKMQTSWSSSDVFQEMASSIVIV